MHSLNKILLILLTTEPFLIRLSLGKSIPNNLDVLADFLVEYEDLKQSGLDYNGSNTTFGISVIVCDAPARGQLQGSDLSPFHRNLRGEQVFRGRTNPLEIYDDVELHSKYRFVSFNMLIAVKEHGNDTVHTDMHQPVMSMECLIYFYLFIIMTSIFILFLYLYIIFLLLT